MTYLQDEGSTQDVVDVILDIWYTLLQMMDTLPRSPLDQCMLRVVECYVKCHLAPPTGIRDDSQDLDEVNILQFFFFFPQILVQ